MSAPCQTREKGARKTSGKRRCLDCVLIEGSCRRVLRHLPASNRPGNCVRCSRLPTSPENIKNAPHHLHRRHNCRKRPSQCAGLEGIRISERGLYGRLSRRAQGRNHVLPSLRRRLGRSARLVVQDGGEFKVTVADLSRTEVSEGNVMAYAVFMLSRRGEIKIHIPHSTRRIIGQQASLDGVDGSVTYASVFFHNRRLYQIEGTVPAGGSAADAFRFQQSFDFTDGWRLPDALSNEIRAR